MIATAPSFTVGIAECVVVADPDATLVTYALGSCLGIAVHDAVAGVGGLLHAMLPDSTLARERAEMNPLMFVDTGVPLLFRECYALGARKERMSLTVAGGASLLQSTEADTFQVGKRNVVMLRKLLWKNGVLIRAQDVGGNHSRTMSIRLSDGEVRIRANGMDTVL